MIGRTVNVSGSGSGARVRSSSDAPAGGRDAVQPVGVVDEVERDGLADDDRLRRGARAAREDDEQRDERHAGERRGDRSRSRPHARRRGPSELRQRRAELRLDGRARERAQAPGSGGGVADVEQRLEVVPGEGLERDERLRARDAGQLADRARDDVRELLVPVDAHEADEVPLAGDGVRLRDARRRRRARRRAST